MSTENKLLTAFTTFMLEHGIECVEDIHQNDTVGEDSLELIEDLFNIIDIQIKCDNKQTNADRIRNMSDEELAEFLAVHDLGLKGNDLPMLTDWFDWLQSEAE